MTAPGTACPSTNERVCTGLAHIEQLGQENAALKERIEQMGQENAALKERIEQMEWER